VGGHRSIAVTLVGILTRQTEIDQARTVGETVRASVLITAGILALLFFLPTFSSPALAGPPEHLRGEAEEALDIEGLNHACGAATDSRGDVYVSSAGDSKIYIFDPEHHQLGERLAEITNSNEPCGLAVDSKGNLYASEKATGKVVRYVPSAYPFSVPLTYTGPTPIDTSGLAKGIAVDPTDDRLYVAKGDHVAVYKSDGSFEAKVGEGQLTNASGVAAYTSPSGDRYVSAADGASDAIGIFGGKSVAGLSLHQTIDGSDDDAFKADKTPNDGMGFGPAGASLTADRASGHIFVYDDEHKVVNEFEANGAFLTQIPSPEPPSAFADAEPTGLTAFPARNEVQRLETGCEGGSFTLSFEAESTAPIPCSATASQVQAALQALSTIGAGNVAVSGRKFVPFGNYSIAFVEDLGNKDVDQLVADGSGLTGFSFKFASVTTEAQGSGPGRVYATAGAGAGAKLLAFGPLAPPARADLSNPFSLTLKSASSVAIDAYGNRYVGAGASIGVYPSDGDEPLATIPDSGKPYDLAVDSDCNVYALDENAGFQKETVVYFTPTSCPLKAGTKYSGPTLLTTNGSPNFDAKGFLSSIGINPVNGHVYVSQSGSGGNPAQIIEFDSAKKVVNPHWGSGLVGPAVDIEAYGANGNVYVSDLNFNGQQVRILNSAGTAILAEITGVGGPRGKFNPGTRIAVNQANGHLVAFANTREVAEEYEESGAFVAEFGSFTAESQAPYRVAIDNSCDLQKPPLGKAACEAFDSSYGNVYVAFDDPAFGTFDLTAFSPLSYGGPPIVTTGTASKVGGGSATLNGTVDPGVIEVEACGFEYLTDAEFQSNIEAAEEEGHEDPEAEGYGFEGATAVPCAEALEEIGIGEGPVPVHADIGGLDPEGRYRFRLVAENKYGSDEGDPGVFGPPEVTEKPAQPVSYHEATLRATIDPSGLATKYHFEYGTSATYGQVTSTVELQAQAGPTDVAVPIFGLVEGTPYHFRVVVESEVKTIEGLDQTFETLQRRPEELCPNDEYRIGLSANLPDCRAYELVTPAETSGLTPEAEATITRQFNNWLVAPSGGGVGERLSFFTVGTLPGFDGNGILDGYRARRASGAHPSEGWSSELFSPTYLEGAFKLNNSPSQEGVASDQEFSLWHVNPFEGTLAPGSYLRTSAGFEVLGVGTLGSDLEAFSHYVSPGGAHVIFSSTAHLEEAAPPKGINAIYDRAAGKSTAEVISVDSEGDPFGADASYLGATEDGSAVAFEVGGALYLRRDKETVQVAAAPNTFAGISEDGRRVFYVDDNVSGQVPAAAGLWVCEVDAGPCAGPGAHAATRISEKEGGPASGRFVVVSTDGSAAYFTSTEVLDDALEGTLGEDNLYLWDGASETIRFIGLLDAKDLAPAGFQGSGDNLIRWPDAIASVISGVSGVGRATAPARSTPDGTMLVFQSYAQLTPYDNTEATAGACGNAEEANEPCVEIYRYDAEAAPGERLACLSCDPTVQPPSGDSMLQDFGAGATTRASTLIPNITDNGEWVFFSSEDALLPEDANSVADVYEWYASGTGGCKRDGGCLALISSGQGDRDSFLYSMTPDGHDVFFSTLEKLHGKDNVSSPSIYDARVEGGIPDPPAPAPCQGDACQGQGSIPPSLPSPASTGSGGEEAKKPRRKCPKGKRKVRRSGKVLCVKRPGKEHSRHGHRKGGASR
jgi:hypothetical protein